MSKIFVCGVLIKEGQPQCPYGVEAEPLICLACAQNQISSKKENKNINDIELMNDLDVLLKLF